MTGGTSAAPDNLALITTLFDVIGVEAHALRATTLASITAEDTLRNWIIIFPFEINK
jgi:hypothetical protein